MELQDRIAKLEEYKSKVLLWDQTYEKEARSYLNQNRAWVQREAIEAGCFHTLTISPPPMVGGLIMRDVDPFTMMFDPPYLMKLTNIVIDMIDQTIGVLLTDPIESEFTRPKVQVDTYIEKGYAFVAMPIVPDDSDFEDVLDAIKEATRRCGITAERVDEPPSNERITDRILESIQKAEHVIVDLTDSRPNVFYEAGYAQGIGKTPVFIAREGTRLEFDLKDYPVIFFKGMKQLKDLLENRLRGLSTK